ncbi:MAG: polysaccharide pyruvyl transferase family protein [Nostocaceae cyanobacterium]|nr:polysaccharide pyruvyl transferase family protein [Nostocaceae cyanobacterium]
MTTSSAIKIKETLHNALASIETFEQCALLDYPHHANVGDNLIWLGEIFYLTDVLKTKINYASSIENFSDTEMNKSVGKSPIFLHGGGNLGDIWPKFQNFREQIISKYHDRPIIIFPQTVYFANHDNLLATANIFNSHPKLMIFVRDNFSYKIAQKYFDKCQVIKAPDMAFQLAGMPGLSGNINHQNKKNILYQCRQDIEINQIFASDFINDLSDLFIEDWTSYKYRNYYQKMGKMWRLAEISECWKEGKVISPEFISRQIWKYLHSSAAKFTNLYNPRIHRKSFGLMHMGVYQFNQYRLIITNRLHGHILCTLMNIPHIFLPNSYYKNESFYEDWTYSNQSCRFIKDPRRIQLSAQELLDLFVT